VNKRLKTAGITVLAAAAAGALVALIVRNQISRHQRGLFSPRALQRLAALSHMSGAEATVDNIRLLRDFLAWEPRRLLRDRARGILARMEGEVTGGHLRAV
jgi:hypothetical protein